jgi:hypothetical protein
MAAIELYSTPIFNDSNLVSYYRMEGNGNDSKASNNGTPYNVTFGTSYGKFNQGASFNGSSSRITVVNGSGLNVINYTISLWSKRNVTNTEHIQCMLSNKYQNFVGAVIIYYTSGNLLAVNHQNGTNDALLTTSSTFVDTSNYHHIVVTHENSSSTIYYDGVAVTNGSHRDPDYGGSYQPNFYQNIGAFYTPGYAGSYHNGYIDDVAIFSRALTADEVYKLYTGNWNKNQFFFNAL